MMPAGSVDGLVRRRCARSITLAAGVLAAACGPCLGQWSNSGGNAQRNGQTTEAGPASPDVLWDGGRRSIISWQPVIEGRRVFLVRQTGFPPEPASDESPVVAMDLDTGDELWFREIPAEPGDWTTALLGVRDGRVFATRAGNGSSVSAIVWCLDAETGDTLWMSTEETAIGFYDGAVFADDGDLIAADFRTIKRFDAETGDLVWSADRSCSVSGTCGAALFGGKAYVIDAAPGGHVVKRFDLASGAFELASELMPGFTIQTTPMIGPDGTIYVQRVQNNPAVDFFYALSDNGPDISVEWSIEAGWTTSSEFTVGPDGSVYAVDRDYAIVRLDPGDGSVLDTSVPLAGGGTGVRMAADRDGRVFAVNGEFATGRAFAFDAELAELWSVPVTNVNIGGPAIGPDGTLVIAGVGTDVRAFRSAAGGCLPDLDGDGELTLFDFLMFQNLFDAGDPAADFDGDGSLTLFDFLAFQNAFDAGC
ncbi:MAG: PQQ-binding-like beta-propeller repeat protein [Planctomycetota bacterium]